MFAHLFLDDPTDDAEAFVEDYVEWDPKTPIDCEILGDWYDDEEWDR